MMALSARLGCGISNSFMANSRPQMACRSCSRFLKRRVHVDFPAWMISRLDKEAKRLGVP
jgi:hypothetical protein